MPFVHIRVTREGVTAEQKAKLIRGATDLLKDVLGKPPQKTMVVIEEVDMDNWGVGGESVTELRRKG
jgi:4-oxalocrotonate tautomerase